MDTSSLRRSLNEGTGFFLLQEGVVPWEEPGTWLAKDSKTLSFITGEPAVLTDVFRWLLTAGPAAFLSSARVHLTELAAGLGAMATERLLSKMRVDPPGTSGTTVERLADGVVCTIARILRPDEFSLEYLTAYRSTVVVTAAHESALQALPQALLRARPSFDRRGLVELRAGDPRFCLIRALGLETHEVLQVIGPLDAVADVESALASASIGRIRNPDDVPVVIRHLRAGQRGSS